MATKKKVVKKNKPKGKIVEAAILTQDQIIGLAAMISEGTAFLLGMHGVGPARLTDVEIETINKWFVETPESKNFVNSSGVFFLLSILTRITGEKFGQPKVNKESVGANTVSKQTAAA